MGFLTSPERRVITFYSFKGGVGRTMTLANVAYRMANKHGLKVIAVDWDLEAPGLHRFFGLSSKDATKAHGVLDYFGAWRGAVERGDPQPPDVSPWIIPITDEEHAPRFGSLSLLVAGKIDGSYDSRLAAFHWQDFYKNGAGASAVETLREQLTGKADVVLIDSRTGFNDASGICTLQIPDGVVLMTAPNQQSLQGIGLVARSIAKAPKETRSGREQPRMWLVTSRVPIVEETYLAERWFADNEPWFAAGRDDGLWLKEDHPEGFQSHKIPHRGRWGFDEAVLNEASNVDPSDLLVEPYDRLTETLLRWLRGEPPIGMDAYKGASIISADLVDIQALETQVADAERRGDILGMATSLNELAVKLVVADRVNEAIRKAEQASGIFLSRGSRVDYLRSIHILGWALNWASRYDEASQTLVKAVEGARELGDRHVEVRVLIELAEARFGQRSTKEALKLMEEAYSALRAIDESEANAAIFFWMIGNSFATFGHPRKAIKPMRDSARVARNSADIKIEEFAIESLLKLSDAGENFPDADVLRARLAELKAALPARRDP